MSLKGVVSGILSVCQKRSIAFLIVRRHDLGNQDDLIRYVSVKPRASIQSLRYKIWHLLDLPDFCDEVIVLKTSENVEIPLSALRKGNQPNRPFILEVWRPTEFESKPITHNNMLTMGNEGTLDMDNEGNMATRTETMYENCPKNKEDVTGSALTENESKSTIIFHKPVGLAKNMSYSTFTHLESHREMSNASIIFKLQGKKNNNNFATVLFKIQKDLNALHSKLLDLESRM